MQVEAGVKEKTVGCGNKRNTDQWASTKSIMEGFSLHNASLIGRKNQAKFEYSMTVFQEMGI